MPFLQHTGASHDDPIPCDCSKPVGTSQQCNEFDLLFGVMVFDYTKNSTSLDQYRIETRPFIPILEYFYATPIVEPVESNTKVKSLL